MKYQFIVFGPNRGWHRTLETSDGFGGVHVVLLFIFGFCAILCLYVLSPLRFPHTNDVVFVFTPPVVCRRVHVLFTLFVFVGV